MARQPAKEPGNRRRTCQAAVTAVLLLGVAAAQGAEVEKTGPRKPAWKWSLDERLAARFDPGAMAARDAELQAEEDAARKRWSNLLAEEEAQMKGPPPATETIDGSKTPELILPGELFSMLLRRGLPSEERKDLQESRGRIEERAAALGFGRDLWDRLAKAVAPYLSLLYDEERRHPIIAAEAPKAEDSRRKAINLRLCRARARALEAAKAEFGEEAFLRLLYEAVAPNSRRLYVLEPWPPDYQQHAERLRFEEEGCR